jgi:hypothetical protein
MIGGDQGLVSGQPPLQTIFTTQLSNMGDTTRSALASTPCCCQAIRMDWHPVLGQLYFTENRRDWLADNIPSSQSSGAYVRGFTGATPIISFMQVQIQIV